MSIPNAIRGFLLFSVASSIVPAGAETAVTRQLESFNSVILNGIGIVHIHKGAQSIKLAGNESSLKVFETSVKNGNLTMGFGKSICLHPFKKYEPLEIDICMPEIKKITINGNGIIKTDEFDFSSLTVVLNGNATVETAGTTPSLILNCTGNAKFSGFSLSAQKVNAKCTGNVYAEIYAEENLVASVTGSGKIIYHGNPKIEKKTSGIGEILKDNN
jgi:hypothetical protein